MTSATFQDFQDITGADVRPLLADIATFTASGREEITAYYSGTVKVTPTAALGELARLRIALGSMVELATLNRKRFTRFDQWELLDLLDDLTTKLYTVYNASKFLRSSRVRDSFARGLVTDVTMKRNQTLENVVERNSLLETDWVELALRNDLNEEKYTPNGGTLLRATFPLASGLFLRTVVDSLDRAEKTKGLDLPIKTVFMDDDLAVLGYQETFEQSVLILGGLRQGDNPSFPQDGLQSSLVVGNTLGGISYPALFRQLYATFSKDDTIASLEVTYVGHKGDSFYITVNVTDRTGEVKEQTIDGF
jgi:hypothetical protein